MACSAFSPSTQVSIDYVIVNEAHWDGVPVPDVPKNVDIENPAVSDDCPVFVDVVLPR